jgi:peptide/nickel transport system permease protein
MQSNMLGYTFQRLAAAALLLVLVLSFTFFLIHLAPGDPTMLTQDPRLDPEDREALRRVWGLDRPLAEQYLIWMRAVLLRGDWGVSYVHARPVLEVIAERVPATLLLAGVALGLQFALGLILGVTAARRAHRPVDHLIRMTSLLFYSLPVFWTGLMALLLLSHRWALFPAGHMGSVDAATLMPPARLADLLHHLALPVLVLVVVSLRVGAVILVEASLSFLGLGVQPPTPSWGNIIADGVDALASAWWVTTFPGLAISVTVIAFNLLGDGVRDLLDPRQPHDS